MRARHAHPDTLSAPALLTVRISANVTGDFGNVTDLGDGAGLRG